MDDESERGRMNGRDGVKWAEKVSPIPKRVHSSTDGGSDSLDGATRRGTACAMAHLDPSMFEYLTLCVGKTLRSSASVNNVGRKLKIGRNEISQGYD